MNGLLKIRRAVMSVSDKRGIEEFARALTTRGVQLVATGGTERALREAGIAVTSVSEITGFPEILGGRVKTLHTRLLAGILARKDDPTHSRQLEELGIPPVDLVVVNLYPFEKTVAQASVSLDEALEQIDIGGPTMIRAAAKNFPSVAVVVDPEDYPLILEELDAHGGSLTLETRKRLAAKVFARTAQYDAQIARYLADGGTGLSEVFSLTAVKHTPLRYGENPHLAAAFYAAEPRRGLAQLKQLQGKELSFNNLLDVDAAVGLVLEFEEPAVCIVKHNNPCGVGTGSSLPDAYEKALACDPVSAFGGIVACNRQVDRTLAEKLSAIFLEVVVAPAFSQEAVELLGRKKNLRLLTLPYDQRRVRGDWDVRSVWGGWLVQEFDASTAGDFDHARVVTQRAPSDSEWEALRFAWKVARWVKSNAVVFAASDRTLGIGAGQMSRVDSVHLAAWKAGKAGLSLAGSVLASDAFFPFRDGVDAAAEAGATAIVQPGGSVRDEEVIRAADEHGLAMVFTGVRHFRH
ncbi:MAG: bifunctional phosphoribosylaminoimidazolecarboxamide formyltransferase/IMP cyclohydrolase [candidate division KSB1 bacterium]|nr:bifunctional phosphoribosylaminoimidazolecarboxamide formyltransferase/IMP cyclohydrolase [candidate division KSB1 bacterium]